MANKEIEKRYLITEVAKNFPFSHPRVFIEQGYVERAPKGISFRVRTKNSSRAVLTAKSGQGISRDEDELTEDKVTIETAHFLFKYLCEHNLEKDRYSIGGWEIDFFKSPLDGIAIAEKEFGSIEEVPADLKLPEWIGKGIDVTDSLTSHHLARLATLLKGSNEKAVSHVLKKLKLPIPKIVITGPPCSGKTKMMGRIKEIMPQLHCVPEVASIIMKELGVRPAIDDFSNIMFQETLYRVQDIFEATSIQFAMENGMLGCALDRGTLDNLGYFPGGKVRFIEHLKTTLENEYNRYRGVICLAIAPKSVYDEELLKHPTRTESYKDALILQQKMIEAWQGHPNFYFIENMDEGWDDKERRVFEAIDSLITKNS